MFRVDGETRQRASNPIVDTGHRNRSSTSIVSPSDASIKRARPQSLGVSPALESPIEINGCEIRNRLYRAPLLECAGDGEDAVDVLIDELEPAAASGTGLIFQGAAPVRDASGRVAPNMTPFADPDFVASLEPLTAAVHDHGGRIFVQLAHGGIRTLETWHAEYRRANPALEQLAVSPLPWQLRAAAATGALDYDPHVLSTAEVYDLAADFGRAAKYALDAGYDGIHLSGANMGIVQQFLSPFYNRRDDEFGGTLDDRVRFLEVVHDAIREHAGSDVPLITKVPAETEAPRFVRRHLSFDEGVAIARRLERIGYDAVAPVRVSTFWDMSLIRGDYPERAWEHSSFQSGYEDAFDSRLLQRLVPLLNRLQARRFSFEPAWNADFCDAVRDAVSIPVLAEGGIRQRGRMDRLLSRGQCDMVGMGRPFYAEPRIAARILAENVTEDVRAVCDNCNNCTVPQVTGAPGMCRTPTVLRERGELERDNAYDRTD